jgi:hypothetical protein
LACLLALLVAGCTTTGSTAVADYLPADQAVAGWSRLETPRTFTVDTLYDLVDGQADAFFAYGFDQAALGRYGGPDTASLRIEIFRLASPADAYGLFSVSLAGQRVVVGAEGDTDPGRRLAFWQDRYYVRIQAAQPLPDDTLLAFGRTLSRALPEGSAPPALVGRLPAAGLEPRSARFFRQEISIQSWLWLGGDNRLGLSAATSGVLADYGMNGQPARLLLVVYPAADQAEAARRALEGGAVEGLLVAGVKDATLGAVFGTADSGLAGILLEEALQ